MKRWIAHIQEQVIERRPVTGTLIFSLIALPFLGLLMALQGFAMWHAPTSLLYAHGGLWVAQGMLAGLSLWLGALAIHAWRTRADECVCTHLPWMTVTPTVIVLVVLGIGYGLKDTPFSLPILAALFLGRALFGMRTLVPSLLIAAAVLIFNELLYLSDHLRYAPLLSKPVFDGGPLNTWWAVWVRVVFNFSALPFSLMVFFLFGTLAKRRRELEDLVRTDMLTGLANRRTFMAQLEIESHRHARNKRPFCLVMCDVDHFKKINDTWGHPAGDTVLVELGRILRRTTREQLDTAARIGGEEFAVLMPETSLSQAMAMAEAMSEGVRSRIFVFDGKEVSITQSVGIAQTDHGDGEQAMRVADDNLYEAKRKGRDRIVATLVEATKHSDPPAKDQACLER